jgi:hypothetical protein
LGFSGGAVDSERVSSANEWGKGEICIFRDDLLIHKREFLLECDSKKLPPLVEEL